MSFVKPITLSDNEFLYYSRQLLLPDWSESQQLALKQKTVLIIGLGGLGCPAATYLAGAGVGQLWLCDGDKVELSNLPRQPLYKPADVGMLKATAAKAALSAYNPFIQITAFTQNADEQMLHLLLTKVDFVLDCSDNLATKLLLNRLCLQYQRSWAGASAVAYQGYSWFMPASVKEDKAASLPQNTTGCLQCLGHNVPLAVGGCSSQGAYAPLVATLALQLCITALDFLRGIAVKTRFQLYQHQNQNFVPLSIAVDPQCSVCQLPRLQHIKSPLPARPQQQKTCNQPEEHGL
ncbi:HesA/MoeB/ThiF family protein [Rheinheimera sp.]|uniref:HesA/MoeB/ThiF family protein n=1 Tax=Rheinheimera sp. TaxID=1869214 RepID=UPI0027B9AD13|nr:HesA/MoeB/ThiF family protein [Rheinheimera sp.]